MADVMQRALALLVLLQSGKAFSGEELAARLDVPPRTLRRDINRLRGYGYPVETQPGPGGYYRLTAGRTMPPLLLDDDEAIATLLGLAVLGATGTAREGSLDDAATRAYGKVDQFLPKRLRPRAAALRAGLETTPTPTASTSAQAMSTLAEAIAGERVVTFEYVGAAGQASTRTAEPYRQMHLLLHWYLLAWDTGKRDWRVFRIDRLTGLRATGQTFSARPLPAESGIEFLRKGVHRNRQRVVVTIAAPMPEVADAFSFQDVDLTATDGGTRAVLMVDSWQWLLPRLAFLDADFTVEAPAELRSALRRFGARLGSA
ncbi:helix-turn-helix transcriptional regulator [Amycolatopsis jejuensis]|uniref:helix-turn-helix transcriptional regulator n=1 Tax=Amycolatopsis jejuensis TaxID=330084 RepID=UPI0005266032|nr:YafY family protein [Amycolatopsis jejuensis]